MLRAWTLAWLTAAPACREHAPAAGGEAEAVLAPTTPHAVDLRGRATDPLADSAASLTVLAFLSTHCPISNRYAPTLRAIHDDYAARGVAFYLVYPDPEDEPDAISTHVREHALAGSPIRDPGHRLVAASAVRVTPEVAVFRRDGERQSLAYHGRIDDRVRDFGNIKAQAGQHDLVQTLDALLSGRPVPNAETPAVGCVIEDLR
jgi:hypothetical protein